MRVQALTLIDQVLILCAGLLLEQFALCAGLYDLSSLPLGESHEHEVRSGRLARDRRFSLVDEVLRLRVIASSDVIGESVP